MLLLCLRPQASGLVVWDRGDLIWFGSFLFFWLFFFFCPFGFFCCGCYMNLHSVLLPITPPFALPSVLVSIFFSDARRPSPWRFRSRFCPSSWTVSISSISSFLPAFFRRACSMHEMSLSCFFFACFVSASFFPLLSPSRRAVPKKSLPRPPFTVVVPPPKYFW